MEDLNEMFAQMMTFQMESQQNWGKTPTTSEIKRRKNLKKEEKQQRFFLELQKQEALFKSTF